MKSLFTMFSCVCSCLLLPLLCYGQQQAAGVANPAAVTVTGRALVQQHGKTPWVIVHGKDKTAYVVTGILTDKVKAIAAEQGSSAVVTLQGTLNGKSNVSCQRASNFETDDKGMRKLVVSARCIRYHFLEVTKITDVVKSDEIIPDPARDAAAEKQAVDSLTKSNQTQGIMGEMSGKIKACNFKSVPKSIDLQNEDKQSPLKSLTVIMTADTRIVKHLGNEEPSPLLPENLKPGQLATVVYTRNEIRSEALFITVTQE